MNPDTDLTRIVRSWLRDDEHESADRVLDIVLSQLDTTPQRRAWGLVRRNTEMNAFAKVLIAAAAVVLVAVVGFAMLPRSAPPVGAPAPTPSLRPTPSPSPGPTPTQSLPPTPSPSSSPVAFAYPADTDLEAGARYEWVVKRVSFSLTPPGAGWSTKGAPAGTLNRDNAPLPGGTYTGSWMLFWNPATVNVSPCSTSALDPAPGPLAADLAAAIAAMPVVDVVDGPSQLTVGGFPATYLEVALPGELGCAPESDNLWLGEGPACGGTGQCWRYASEPGQTIQLWIVDADGGRVMIEAETYQATPDGIRDEIQQIVDSVEFS